jgi:hypothetical protein
MGTSDSCLDTTETFIVNGTVTFTKNLTISANQTLTVNGIVNIPAGKTLTVAGKLNASKANAKVVLTGDAGTGGALTVGTTGTLNMAANTKIEVQKNSVLTMNNGSTLSTAANSSIEVQDEGKMTLSDALTKVTHDGVITVQEGGELDDKKPGGGQLWNDGLPTNGATRTGKLRIEYGGIGTISGMKIVDTTTDGTALIQLDDNPNVGTQYVELGSKSAKLNGTAELHGSYSLGPGSTLEITNKSELIIHGGDSGVLTLDYDPVTKKDVAVTLGGRSDEPDAADPTLSNITVEDGAKLIDERPFQNEAATENYLWPVSGYTFQGAAGRPLITIVKGGIVETDGGVVVIDDIADDNGWLSLAGDFQVLSTAGDLAITDDATLTSNVHLKQKLTLKNGADIVVDAVKLFVMCTAFDQLKNHLMGTILPGAPDNPSVIHLDDPTSYLEWTGSPMARSGAKTFTWDGSTWGDD